jgi:hypothetical protein
MQQQTYNTVHTIQAIRLNRSGCRFILGGSWTHREMGRVNWSVSVSRLICKPLFWDSFARISVRDKVWQGDRHVILLVLWTSKKAVVSSRAQGRLCLPLCGTADGTRKRLSLLSDPSAHCVGEGTILPGADITSNIMLLVYASFVKQRGRKTCLALEQKHRELHFTTWQPLSYVWSSLLPGRIVKWHRFKTFVRIMS